MSDMRESHIKINNGNFNPDTGNLRASVKVNMGTKDYDENMNKIKDFGLESEVNLLAVGVDFISEEAANNAATKVGEIYEKILPKVIPLPPFWDAPKVKGKTLVLTLRIPTLYADQLAILEPIITSFGELTAIDQYLEFDASCLVPAKDSDAAVESVLNVGSAIKIALVTHKDLPVKINALMKEMGVGGGVLEIMKPLFGSLKHVRLEACFDDLTEGDKEEIKNKVKVGALFIGSALESFGLVETVMAMQGNIVGALCIKPCVSLNFKLTLPGFIEILKAANPK